MPFKSNLTWTGPSRSCITVVSVDISAGFSVGSVLGSTMGPLDGLLGGVTVGTLDGCVAGCDGALSYSSSKAGMYVGAIGGGSSSSKVLLSAQNFFVPGAVRSMPTLVLAERGIVRRCWR